MNKTDQYKLLDYLRLFRLCKNLGYIKRQRKMPNQYKSKNGWSAHLRLFSELLKNHFQGYVINSQRSRFMYRISLSKENQNIINNINTNTRYLIGRPEEILYNNLYRRHFICPCLPHEVCINLYSNEGKYAIITDSSATTFRPQYSFYDAALDCIQYKKELEEALPALDRLYKEKKIEEEEAARILKEARQQRRAAQKIILMEKNMRTVEQEILLAKEKQKLEEKINQQKQQSQDKAQEAFNKALLMSKGAS
jgi:hypothetical protein